MWKILVGFIAFAALALFIIFKAGDKVDMQGESVGTPIHETTEAAPASTVAAPVAAADQSAASAIAAPASAAEVSASAASK